MARGLVTTGEPGGTERGEQALARTPSFAGMSFPVRALGQKDNRWIARPGVMLDVSDNRSPEQEIGENRCVWIFTGQRYNHLRAGG